jgi:TolB protein
MVEGANPGFARRGRSLLPGQIAELTVSTLDGSGRQVIFTASEIIEAPNWTPDGRALIFNAGGELWRIPADGSAGPEKLDTGPLRDLNNDHCLSPDGQTLYVSSDDGHLYALPIGGGTPRRLSNDQPGRFKHYLHGVSPDGTTLAYVGVQSEGQRTWNIFTIPASGGPDTQLTDTALPCDGCEYSPDGEWLWFNAEFNSPGHAQIFRMRPDGSNVTQVTYDDRVNWFPHFTPDGQTIVYLSYPPGTEGHPADKDVILRTIRPEGGATRDVARFNGGQGTINVNSCAPDNQRFAYVAYPIAG